MPNFEIKQKIAISFIPKWRIAKAIGIADATFSRWLREELTDERKQKVLDALEKLVTERGA